MRFLDLCAGIGGFSLGLEWAGMMCAGQVEIDPYCNKVLEKHWPHVGRAADLKDAADDISIIHDILEITERSREAVMSCKQDPKYDSAKTLYEQGLSIGKIANVFGVTRQAMHAILKRRGVRYRDNVRFGEDNHFYRGGLKMKKSAQDAVDKAIRSGKLARLPCSVCGATPIAKDGRSLIQAHHWDYSKPLDVIWLCQRCHHEEHKKGKSGTHANGSVDLVCGGYP